MTYKVHCIDVKNQLQNYIWILEDSSTKEAVVIDPTEAQLVQEFCQTHNLILSQIWLTYWHKDHIGGVPELITERNIPVYGPREELSHIPFISRPLQHENHFKFNHLKVDILAVPGHTLGHIVYFIDELDILFCGDTLFAMGCGRVFEGTYAQMYHSLNRLAALPPRTQVYCTHEYTLSNAEFALTVEPDNLALHSRVEQVRKMRDAHQCTLPTTIALELETNPFLRAESEEEFSRIRILKDNF
ncbi:hydroxyacylglutathione hydrolase [Acinetobacter radioresistens]|uniref:hydroxyacylglutathione hydrolase n=1 Tax=Acinetobacter radioresistens TaxID=40216 RepID=UPI00157A837C|nr:hydroxyacylglutathione hydrolase [Acinetobacter radioresistens]MCK4111165.1 hydroxyacylglutathione hydrolase [Acinetobacter radioresistens]MCU4384030.1 hydroxyacylglutathione hydrolase [Acinetobacter radioresistens]NTY96492.1 hydroxyacylglutathione hydrolase [Acinetobacter radioresistens]